MTELQNNPYSHRPIEPMRPVVWVLQCRDTLAKPYRFVRYIAPKELERWRRQIARDNAISGLAWKKWRIVSR